MYIPTVNAEKDLPTLRQFVRDHSLCALVTQTGNGMIASHIPMVLHEDDAGFGTLRGHVARLNPQWRDFTAGHEALGIFTGAQHFISASWYPGPECREVPTWNYVAVHVYGSIRAIDDTDWLLQHLRTLTEKNEAIVETPWRVSDAPKDFIEKMSRAIVGIELPVSRVEGKWKVSQNRNEDDAAGVLRGLETLGTSASMTMRDLVRSRRPR